MYIINAYLNSKLRWRLLGDAVLLAIFALFLWVQEIDMALPMLLALGVVAGIEVLFFFKRHLASAIITVFFVAGVSYLSYSTYALLTSYGIYDSTANYLIAGAVGLFGLIGMVLSLVGGFLLGKGQVWLTLTFAYIGYFAAFITTGAIFSNLSPLIYSLAGMAAMLIIVSLRSLFPRTKRTQFNWSTIPPTKQASVVKTKVQQLAQGSGSTAVKVVESKYNQFFFLRTGYAFLAILPLAPQQGLELRKNKLLLDGQEITGVLEAYMNELLEYGREHKIPIKFITPVIYVAQKNKLGTDIAQLNVARRIQPEKILGSVFIVSADGFLALLNRIKKNGVKLPEKLLAELD